MGEKKLILVIDDEKDLTDIIKYEFEALGFDIRTAADGVEGLEALKSISPQLIILDLNMPRMGGVEFYKNILDEKGNPPYPVLVLTARVHDHELLEKYKFDSFMTKPFEIPELIERCRQLLGD